MNTITIKQAATVARRYFTIQRFTPDYQHYGTGYNSTWSEATDGITILLYESTTGIVLDIDCSDELRRDLHYTLTVHTTVESLEDALVDLLEEIQEIL